MRPTGTADLAQSVILQDDVADGSQSCVLSCSFVTVSCFVHRRPPVCPFAAGTPRADSPASITPRTFAGSVDIGLAPSASVGLREASQPIAAQQTVFVLATRAEWGHRYPLHQLGPGFG